MSDESFIERRIVIGFIVSTEYIQHIHRYWNSKLLEATTARILVSWCLDHFNKYNCAPSRDIESIYTEQLQKGLDKDKAEWIEGVLRSLDDEYERGHFNVDLLLDQTKDYIKRRALQDHAEAILEEVKSGEIKDAESRACGFTNPIHEDLSSIDPFTEEAEPRYKAAFEEREKPLIKFPKALGEFWNREMVRGGFVALMGPEKIGKTFMLWEIAIRGMMTGLNVAFMQAGDMTEKQQLRRTGIWLHRRSDDPRYCQPMYIPVVDCLYHQLDTCERDVREEESAPVIAAELKNDLTYRYLVGQVQRFPQHKTCRNCQHIKGSPWFVHQEAVEPLTWNEAYKAARTFGKRYKRRFKLDTYASKTLSVGQIKAKLVSWERSEGFVADVVVVDYADILAPDPDFSRFDQRSQVNEIWLRLRSLSEERHCLVVTATQVNAKSYKKMEKGRLLDLDNFSEDKRKYAHVTAIYGLNQDEEQKQIGLMRINEMLVRESDFNRQTPVTVLQRLQQGRPFLGSWR